MKLLDPESIRIGTNLKALDNIRVSLSFRFQKGFRGVLSSSVIENFLDDLAYEVSWHFDPARKCKITTYYFSLAIKRINDLLDKHVCKQCWEIEGIRTIERDRCNHCGGEFVKVVRPPVDWDENEKESFVSHSEWFSVILMEDEIPESFLALRSKQFCDFAIWFKGELSPKKRIILATALLRRDFTMQELEELRRLDQSMAAIPKAKFDVLKKLHEFLAGFESSDGNVGLSHAKESKVSNDFIVESKTVKTTGETITG